LDNEGLNRDHSAKLCTSHFAIASFIEGINDRHRRRIPFVKGRNPSTDRLEIGLLRRKESSCVKAPLKRVSKKCTELKVK
jgi:hypothetical protein